MRTIAMGSTEGLKRGLPVSNSGAPISVPVGQATLGRIMDVLGRPIDEAGPVNAEQNGPFIVKHQVMMNSQIVQNF